MIPRLSAELAFTSLAEPPSARNVLEMFFWNGVSLINGAGSQTDGS
jgi:hypothetical protein